MEQEKVHVVEEALLGRTLHCTFEVIGQVVETDSLL